MPNLLTRLFATKEAAAAPEAKEFVGTDYLGRTNPIELLGNALTVYQGLDKGALLRDGYSANAVAYSIISYIQTTAKSTEWNVYGLTSADKNAQVVPNHPLAARLYRPNPKQSWSEFKAEIQGHYLLTGNAFIWKNQLTSGKVEELWVLPYYTEIVGGGYMKEVSAYRVPKGNGEYDTYAAKDVLHLKTWNPEDSRYGLSPISAGYKVVTSAAAGLDLRIKQYQNQGVPGILYHDAEKDAEELTPAQVTSLTNKIRNWFRPKSTYTLPFTGAKLGYVRLGLSAVDLDVLKALDADRNGLADLYSFPAQLLNGASNTTFSNVAEARKALWSNCILPLENTLRDGLNHWLGLSYGDQVYIDFDINHIDELQPNRKEKAEWLNLCDFLTINEKREALGFPAVPDGDGYLLPAGKSYCEKLDVPVESPVVATYAAEDATVASE